MFGYVAKPFEKYLTPELWISEDGQKVLYDPKQLLV